VYFGLKFGEEEAPDCFPSRGSVGLLTNPGLQRSYERIVRMELHDLSPSCGGMIVDAAQQDLIEYLKSI
jgi:hypothetical protein